MSSLATPSSAPGDRPALRIGGPADLLDALPRMLGYVPQRSAVLVALRPPRGRLAMTMRVDLPPPRAEASCARLLAGHAQRAGATSAVLVVYDDRPGTGAAGRWRGASLTRALKLALRQRGGLRLDDALAVRGHRWRSLLCPDEGCCPPSGQPLRRPDDPSPIAAALAADGAAVLPDRATLVASVAAPTGERASRLRSSFERRAAGSAASATPARVARATSAPATAAAATAARVTALLDFVRAVADRSAGRVPEEDDAVALALALGDVALRDTVLSLAADEDTDGLLALLLDLAVVAVPPWDPPVLASLAWVAYARGDGTLANIAVDRALSSDPGYSLARLLAAGLEGGVHPRFLRRISADLASDRGWDADGERGEDPFGADPCGEHPFDDEQP